jgi:hypothetical protein
MDDLVRLFEEHAIMELKAALSLEDLVNNTKQVVSTSVGRAEPMNFRFSNVRIKPLRGQIWVDAECFSKNSSKHYHTTIYFYTKKGEEPDYNYTPVRVACQCKAYYFYFAHWNVMSGAHARAPLRPYQRKTPPPPKGRPEVNPKHLPGLCKHLMALADVLMNSGALVINTDASNSKDDKPLAKPTPTQSDTPIDSDAKVL